MRLILVRHAEAEDDTGQGDEARRLTARGRTQAANLAAKLHDLGAGANIVVTSPLARTLETARALDPGAATSDYLRPGGLRPKKLSQEVAALGVDTVAVVGHMPDIAAYAAWLLGVEERVVPFGKCDAACVRVRGELPEAGRGTLEWFVMPAWCE